MWRALSAPFVWILAALLLLARRAAALLSRLLDGYNDAAVAAGHAALRFVRWVLVVLGPVGRALRAVLAPVWRRVVAVWRWLNVQLLLRMFRPLRGFGRWVFTRLKSAATLLAVQLGRLVRALDPLWRRLQHVGQTVERAAARLAEGWRRAWQPVLSRAARWR